MAIAPGSYSFIGGTVLGNNGGKQFVLTRDNMTTAFTDEEYNQCINALMNELAVAVSFGTINGIVRQAQLVSKTNLGALTFSCTRNEYIDSWTVAALSPHSITHTSYEVDDSITPIVTTGTKIAEGNINGQQFELFAPSEDIGIVVFEVSYSENTADYVYPAYGEVASAVSAGKMPVILLYVHNSPIRRCFVFRWLSGGYIHFDNDSQYVEISDVNVVKTGYINDKNLAADYDPTATYNVGDYCMYHNNLFVCTTDISVAEEWKFFHWQCISVSDIVGNVETLLAAL